MRDWLFPEVCLLCAHRVRDHRPADDDGWSPGCDWVVGWSKRVCGCRWSREDLIPAGRKYGGGNYRKAGIRTPLPGVSVEDSHQSGTQVG